MNLTKGIIRKEQIINAANELFLNQGIASSSIDDITKSVNIAKASFYHYFKSKEELVKIVVSRKIDEHIEEIEKICKNDSIDFFERLKICLLKFYSMATNSQWINEVNFGNVSPIQSGLIDEFVDRSTKILGEYMEYGKKIKLVNVTSPQIVTFIIAHGIKDIWKLDNNVCRNFSDDNHKQYIELITTIEEMFHIKKGSLL
ncbi:MAG: TetR/AcrR family transcriptional regulator [Oscillospiraceae bacterium]